MSEKLIPQELYEVLDTVCTLPQIHQLLRDKADLYKRGEIRIGSRKDEMISNLRTAVSEQRIEVSEVHALIRDAEENGNQHIFFYRPKSKQIIQKYSKPDAIAAAMFGEKWKSLFPSFSLIKEGFAWADFRQNGTGSKGWTGKLYGHETRKRLKDEKETDTTYTAIYDKVEVRSVLLMQWMPPDLLEIRVSRTGTESDAKLKKRRDIVWSEASSAVSFKDFEPWDLRPVIRSMIERRREEKNLYTLPSVRLIDSASGVADLHAYGEEEALSDATERDMVLETYLENGCECRRLAVLWGHDLASGIWGEHPLRMFAGGDRINEIVIASTVNAQSVDYVTNRLQQFEN